MVGTPLGIERARSIIRKPMPEKWNKDAAEAIKGWPYNHNGEEGGEARIMFDEQPLHPDAPDVPEVVPDSEPVPRRMRLGKNDLAQHGYTMGCAGCESSKNNRTPRGHSEMCRRRLMDAIQNTDD